MDENLIKTNIAKNITAYRKRMNLTQAQLAEKISYSDKAVSKWERGDGIPDTIVLLQLAELFDVTLNDMVSDKVKKKGPVFLRNRWIISMLSVAIVWLVAVLAWVVLSFIPNLSNVWMSYIVALPVSFIVLIVFAGIWGNKITKLISISGLIWTFCLTLFLFLQLFTHSEENINWIVFIIGIPVQIMFAFFFLLKRKNKNV